MPELNIAQLFTKTSRLSISNDHPSKKTKVLFLAANPKNTDQVRLAEEVRAIDQVVRGADFRDSFDIAQHWAVRIRDIQAHILRVQPNIIHFAGHGAESGEIALETDAGLFQLVSPQSLSQLFHMLNKAQSIKCVVLNACYSATQATAIAAAVDCVVGMPQAVDDSIAIHFAESFYQGLAYGKSLQDAFNLACNQLDLEGYAAETRPQLLCNAGVDPAKIIFVVPNALSPKQQSDISQQRRLNELLELRQQLQKSLEEYRGYLRKYPPYSNTGDDNWHKEIIDRAKDACRAAFDRGDEACIRCLSIHADMPGFDECKERCKNRLAYMDEMRLTPYFVTGESSSEGPQQKAEVAKWGRYEDRNLNALADAVNRIQELVAVLEQ